MMLASPSRLIWICLASDIVLGACLQAQTVPSYEALRFTIEAKPLCVDSFVTTTKGLLSPNGDRYHCKFPVDIGYTTAYIARLGIAGAVFS